MDRCLDCSSLLILVLAIPALLVLFPRAFLQRRQQLEINDAGIAITRGENRRDYAWDDITDVVVIEKDVGKDTASAVGGQLGGLPGGFVGGVLSYFAAEVLGDTFSGRTDTRKTTVITIKTSDGQKYQLDRRMTPWFRLLELFPPTISRLWTERYIRELNNNQDVLVNSSTNAKDRVATLTPSTIANHQQSIPWEAVKDITYEEGQLALRTTQPGLYSMRFNLEGGSVRGQALANTVRAQSPTLRAELERKEKFADKPLWSPRSYGEID